jgi:hypothetical protein
MKKRLRFLWIDDNARKIQQFKRALEAGVTSNARAGEGTVTPYVPSADVSVETPAILNMRPRPDLILIDHVFNVNNPQRWKGSTIAHVLRERWADVPMVCVTSMLDTPRAFNQEDLSEYIAVLPYPRLLDDHLEDLYAIAQDFPKLRLQGKGLRDKLITTLKAPKPERETLERVLPQEFDDQQPRTTQHRIARWIFNVLMGRPGFLYSRLRASTAMGLSEHGFRKVEAMFARARYTGPFHTTANPRWWTNELTRLLYSALPANAPDLPQLAGRGLKGITPADFSRSYIRKEPLLPDVVARVDATSEKEVPVSSRFTVPHPDELRVPAGFESLLVLKKMRRR